MGLAEAGGGDAGERLAAVGPVVELDDDFVARGHLDGGRREQYLLDKTRVIGRDDEFAARAEDVADDGQFLARDDTRDAADGFAGAAAGGSGVGADRDGVPGESDAGVVGRDLHRGRVGTARSVGQDDERGAAAAKLDAAVEFPWIVGDRGGGLRGAR